VNAGRLLCETGYDNEALRSSITPIDPFDINIYPAAQPFRSLWRPGVRGVTHWRWVFIDPEVMRGDRDRLARLVVHELVHVRQYVTTGYVRFMAGYITEYWRGRLSGKDGRQAYLDISAEVEARDLAKRVDAAK